jgi:hypothetical protein
MKGFAIITWPRIIVAAVALAIVGGPATAQTASASAQQARPSFSSDPALDPGFDWTVSDYVVRCNDDGVILDLTLPGDWEVRLNAGDYRSSGNDLFVRVPLAAGKAFRATFRRPGHDAHVFHVRCLPTDFPEYHFSRTATGGPKFFIIQMNTGNYVAIFNRDGVPVWWFKAEGAADNAQLLPDGTLAWDPVDQASLQSGRYRLHTLTGRFLRIVQAVGGHPTDIHELLLLPNGNYLLGAQVKQDHVDASAYGGSSDATVIHFQIQEVTPEGKLVWTWDSQDHIGLEETGRWWPTIISQNPDTLDTEHWNGAEAAGRFLLLSFRQLDAIYEINRRTGNVVWKLGGTTTPKSLDVLDDPQGDYPLGGPHDARLQPDGTITIHDNNTGLKDSTDQPLPPRVVRYQIDPEAGTATLVQSFSEPEVPGSFCCGSARRLPSGDWLVDWGGNGYVAGYDPSGNRLFKLETPGEFSYRANPVPPGALSTRRLRHAMNLMVG